MMKRRYTFLFFLVLLWVGAFRVSAAVILPTDVASPSAGCTFLGIEGKYIVQIPQALERINEIRLEACREGVINPSTGNPLTMADYVPIKWSSDLEYIARIRAAEASLTMDHVRTNGKSCFAIQSPNSVRSYGEVIAWNWGETMVAGINQWYAEKRDWVNQDTSKVTGHYTQMIDPKNLYVGLGTFCSETSRYYNTTAGEYSFRTGLDETQGTGIQDCVQLLEVSNSYLNNRITITGNTSATYGDHLQLSLTTGVSMTDYWGSAISTEGLLVMNSVQWNSSDEKVASVDSSGMVTAGFCGSAQITAQDTSGYKGETTITVNHTVAVDKAVPATCTATGLTEGEHCSVCGAVLKAQSVIPVKEHTWDFGEIVKQRTCIEEGIKIYTCQSCNKQDTKKIAVAGHKWNREYTIDKKASCNQQGQKSVHCSVCGQIKEGSVQILEKTEHTWDSGKTTEQPTCTKTGVRVYSCLICKEQRSENIDLKDHQWSKWKTISRATVFDPEKQRRTCSTCKKPETRSVGKTLTPTIKLNYTSLLLKTGQSTSAVKVSGLAKGDKVVSWKSSNTKIAKVNSKGKITAQKTIKKSKVSTYVTVKLASKKTARIKVTVQRSPVKTKKLTGLKKTVRLKIGEKVTLKPVRDPVTSTEKITYSASGKRIVSVSSKGVVRGIAAGTEKVMVRCGSVKSVVTVKVTRN